MTTTFHDISPSQSKSRQMDRLTKRFNPYHYMYVCTKRKPSGLINVLEDGFV